MPEFKNSTACKVSYAGRCTRISGGVVRVISKFLHQRTKDLLLIDGEEVDGGAVGGDADRLAFVCLCSLAPRSPERVTQLCTQGPLIVSRPGVVNTCVYNRQCSSDHGGTEFRITD